MLFNNHTMTMVTDLSLVQQNDINNRDFVCIAAVTTSNDCLNHPSIYNAGILVPPVEILDRWANGDPYAIQNQYTEYLCNNKDADDMIIALLAALTTKNIILYIPQEEYDIFGIQLINHIYFMYGITMNTPTTVFSFDESKLPLLLSKFYMMDLMEPMDYINSYSPFYKLPLWVIDKLANDLKPFNRAASFEEYNEYFNGLVAKNNPNNTKIQILSRVSK